ncbi:hypothetical protein INR49_029108 [Caranx melampygus]|nr:hypothetical protein INR49_029108 [Caranx melampygus]
MHSDFERRHQHTQVLPDRLEATALTWITAEPVSHAEADGLTDTAADRQRCQQPISTLRLKEQQQQQQQHPTLHPHHPSPHLPPPPPPPPPRCQI